MVSIKIDNVTITHEYPIEFVLDGSEQFNIGTLTIKNSTQRAAYPDFADVELTINSVVYEAIIQKDVSTRTSPDIYKHKITLVEPVVKLSLYTMADRKYDTLAGAVITYEDQADNILLTHDFGRTSPLTIATATRTLLDINAPEKEYTGGTLLITFTDMFRGLGLIPTLSLDNIIGHEAFGKTRFAVTLANIIGETITSDIGNYGLNVHSKIKSGTYEKDTDIGTTYFPSKDSGILARGLKPQFKQVDAVWIIDSGIRRIPETTIMNLELNTGGSNFFVEADISEWVISKDEWDNIEVELTSATLYAGVYKNNSLYYTEGDNIIYNAGVAYENNSVTAGQDVYEAIIWSWLLDNSYLTTDWVPQLVGEIELRFLYQATRDFDVKLRRHNTNRVYKDATVINNQKDSKLELGRYGQALKSHINRIGNDTYEVTKRYKDSTPFTLFSLNDYTSDGYKIIKIHIIARQTSMDVIYLLTKNASLLNQFASVNREVSPFTIQKRNILSCFVYTEYLEFGGTSRTDTGILSIIGKRAILNALKWNATYDTPVFNARYISTSASSTKINMSATKQPMGNALVFNASFKHPKFAGYQQVADSFLGATIYRMIPVPYGDANGEVATFSMGWYNNLTSTPNTYPVGAAAATNELIGPKVFSVGLNPNETLGKTMIIQPVTDRSNLIIHDFFAENNSLMKELTSAQGIAIYHYDGDRQFNIYDKVLQSGSNGVGSFALDASYKTLTISSVPTGSSWLMCSTTAPYNIYMSYTYKDNDMNTIYINSNTNEQDIETL